MEGDTPAPAGPPTTTAPPPPSVPPPARCAAAKRPPPPPAVPTITKRPPPPPSKAAGGGEEKKKATYASAAASGQWTMVERKRGTRPPAKKIWSTEQRCFELLRDRSLPSGIGKGGTSEDLARRTASVQAAISKELHRIGADGRVWDLFLPRVGSTGAPPTPP